MSARRRPQPGDLDRVLHYIEMYEGDEPLTHQHIASVLGLHPRWVFQLISQLDGTRALLGGLPSGGYKLAVWREDGVRRDAAMDSQIQEMKQRLRRRKAFARTLPKRPHPTSNGEC